MLSEEGARSTMNIDGAPSIWWLYSLLAALVISVPSSSSSLSFAYQRFLSHAVASGSESTKPSFSVGVILTSVEQLPVDTSCCLYWPPLVLMLACDGCTYKRV